LTFSTLSGKIRFVRTTDPKRSNKASVLRAEPLREAQSPPPLPCVDGGYRTILADPPWRFAKVAPEHRRLDRYSTMELDDICELPVQDVAATDAHLYLWVPNALLPDGLRVMEAWGFRYISNVIWAKRRKDGGPDGRGVGFYFRNVTEPILFGVRGSMRTLPPARSQVNMIETRKREHSRKPDEQYDLIERCSPGPYLEMFARHPHPGWDVWGDESAAEVAPRGKVRRGYAGGPIADSMIEPGIHLPAEVQADLGLKLRSAYEGGASIRQIAEDHRISIGRARSLMVSAGTQFRGRGRPPRQSRGG
jgi:N6-adenosine-specific RNA methylase IME4